MKGKRYTKHSRKAFCIRSRGTGTLFLANEALPLYFFRFSKTIASAVGRGFLLSLKQTNICAEGD
jgi:hypothetical protein